MKIIDDTTDLFYQQKIKEGYGQLGHTLEKLAEAADRISINNKGNYRHDIREDSLPEILGSAMEAMEAGDMVLFSDILQYELKEAFREIAVLNK